MRVGIICSSGGSAFSSAFKIIGSTPGIDVRFACISDRECGFERFCISTNLSYRRIDTRDNADFSRRAALFLDESGGVDVIILLFSRLVTQEMFAKFPTLNIHPALLPAFVGFNAVKQAYNKRVKFLGATLHMVDSSIDGGAIIAQTCMPILPFYTEQQLGKFSYIQKVFLILEGLELFLEQRLEFQQGNVNPKLAKPTPVTDRCNPFLTNSFFISGIMDLQKIESVDVIK
jgi:phosphoribosylglycinamide formyltransferase-1